MVSLEGGLFGVDMVTEGRGNVDDMAGDGEREEREGRWYGMDGKMTG